MVGFGEKLEDEMLKIPLEDSLVFDNEDKHWQWECGGLSFAEEYVGDKFWEFVWWESAAESKLEVVELFEQESVVQDKSGVLQDCGKFVHLIKEAIAQVLEDHKLFGEHEADKDKVFGQLRGGKERKITSIQNQHSEQLDLSILVTLQHLYEAKELRPIDIGDDEEERKVDLGGKAFSLKNPLNDNWEALKKLLKEEKGIWCGVGQVYQGQVWRVEWEKMEVHHWVQSDR
jgi:hypothetical protein